MRPQTQSRTATQSRAESREPRVGQEPAGRSYSRTQPTTAVRAFSALILSTLISQLSTFRPLLRSNLHPLLSPLFRARLPLRAALLASTFLLQLSTGVLAQAAGYPVESFSFNYGRPHPGLPPLDELAALEIPVSTSADGLLSAPLSPLDPAKAPRANAPSRAPGAATIRLGALPAGTRFSESGLQAVLQGIVAHFNRRDFFGVFVVPSADDLDPQTKVDYRPAARRALALVVWVSEIGQTRIIAKNARLKPRWQERLLRASPLKPRSGDQPGSLLHRGPLEAFLWRLNEHPGRRVEASVTSTDDPGVIALDYLVDQRRPWSIFGQISNTGTDATGEIRSRLSVASNQITSRDDVLSLDYFTTDFTGSQAVFLSYKLPLLYPNRLSARLFGSWGNFNAEPVGVAFEGYSGDNWSGGGELSAIVGRPFGATLETIAGLRFQHFSVKSQTFLNSGETDLFLPYLGLELRRQGEVLNVSHSLRFETNVPEIAGTQRSKLEDLGRLDANAFWYAFRADADASLFVDGLFKFGPSRRAHELYASIRGQYTPSSYRLIGQELDVVGGFFSVRGYPESLAAADSAYAATLEYRLHVPRLLPARQDPYTVFGRSFRLRPRRAGGDTDWDLIWRAFADAGATYNNRIRPEEKDQRLLGAGSGLELFVTHHFHVRVDFAYAFKAVSTELETLAEKGSFRVHALATLAW